MSAYGDNPEFHHVKDGRIYCTASEDAPCRTYPTCDCEVWCCCDRDPGYHDSGEHCCMDTTRPGQPCWIIPWIDAATDLEDVFDGSGADALAVMVKVIDADGEEELTWPDGPVTVDFDGDGCVWSYATEATS